MNINSQGTWVLFLSIIIFTSDISFRLIPMAYQITMGRNQHEIEMFKFFLSFLPYPIFSNIGTKFMENIITN